MLGLAPSCVRRDNFDQLPLDRAPDKRGLGIKILGGLFGYSEREYIIPRDSYAFVLGDGMRVQVARHSHAFAELSERGALARFAVSTIKDGSKLAIRSPENQDRNPFVISLKTPEQWVHDNRYGMMSSRTLRQGMTRSERAL